MGSAISTWKTGSSFQKGSSRLQVKFCKRITMALTIKEREQVGPGAFADQNPELSWPWTLPLPPHPTLSVRGVIYSLLHLGTALARSPHMLQPRSAGTATTGTGGKEQWFSDGVGSWAVPAPHAGSPRFPRADPRVCSQPDSSPEERSLGGSSKVKQRKQDGK